MENNFDNDKLEFRQIILGHIKKILELSTHELRDTTREIIKADHTQVIEQEDLRFSYIQAIENLSYVLLPYFDEPLKKKFNECIEVITAYDFQLNEYFQDEIEILLKQLGKTEIPKVYFIDKKLQYAKKLFIELNLLLKRVDYLKSAIFGEGEDTSEEVIEEEKEGDEE